MKRLILTSSSGHELARLGLADSVLTIWFRFIGEPLPSPEKLDAYFGVGSDQSTGDHWSDWFFRSHERDAARRFIEAQAHDDVG